MIVSQPVINVRDASIYHVELMFQDETGASGARPYSSLDLFEHVIRYIGHNERQDAVSYATCVSPMLFDMDITGAMFLHTLKECGNPVHIEMSQCVLLPSAGEANKLFRQIRDCNGTVGFSGFGKASVLNPRLLSDYSFDAVKFESDFFRPALHNPHWERRLRMIVDLLNEQEKTIIAENVTTDEEKDMLMQCGVHFQQGPLFAAYDTPKVEEVAA